MRATGGRADRAERPEGRLVGQVMLVASEAIDASEACRMRHPVFVRRREDKTARECVG